MKRFIATLLLAATWLVTAQPAPAMVIIDINAPDFRKVPVAVPFFEEMTRPGQADQSGREMAAQLSEALAFHGFISILAPQNYGGGQQNDWKQLGANYTVLGQYQTDNDQITVELRLLDITAGRMIHGRRYRGPFDRKKDILLKFCDDVIEQLTGEKGISFSQIAFISDRTGYKEVFLSDVLGDEIRQVTRHNNLVVSPRFSPDGKLLAYTSYHPGNPNLYITDLSQDKHTLAISRRQGLNLAPAWSPDGKTLALTLSKDGNPDLYLMSPSGVILEQLTSNAGINVSPSWSPDGKMLVFVSDRSGSPQLYIMDMQSRQVSRLTYNGTDNSEPNWSPDGQWIAYAGLQENGYQIFMIRPTGGEAVQLTRFKGNHESPSWSPDSRQLIFSRKYNNDTKIYAIFKNGTGYRTLFDVKGQQTSPQWSARLPQ